MCDVCCFSICSFFISVALSFRSRRARRDDIKLTANQQPENVAAARATDDVTTSRDRNADVTRNGGGGGY